jgi:hypothetical protein
MFVRPVIGCQVTLIQSQIITSSLLPLNTDDCVGETLGFVLTLQAFAEGHVILCSHLPRFCVP